MKLLYLSEGEMKNSKQLCAMINCSPQQKKRRKKGYMCCPGALKLKENLARTCGRKEEDYFIESHKQKSSSESINKTTNNFD